MTLKWDRGTETLRGIAIVLMTAGHVIGHDASAGMKVADDSAWRHFYVSFEFLRMPLFTVISGYVYAIRPIERGSIGRFLLRKTRRLLLPMITVGTAFFCLRLFVPGTNSPSAWTEIWKIYVLPYAHFWYLQALTLVFVTLVALEYVGLTKRVIGWSICWLGSMVLLLFFPVFVALFSFQRYLYLLPFFLFGVGIRRFPQLANNRWALWAALVVLLAGIFYQQMCWYGMLSDDPGPASPVGLTVGMAATLLLFRVRPTWQPLVILGGYAYGIYLLHVFGTAGSRIVLSPLGMDGSAVVFLLGLLLGILIPIGVELATKRIAWARLLIFGQKVKR